MKLSLSFGVKINFLLGLGLAILVSVGILAHRSIEELVETGRDESGTLAALTRIEIVSGSVRGAIAAQRSVLLTHSLADRQAYRLARDRVVGELNGLRGPVEDGEQVRLMRELGQVIDARLERLDKVIEASLRQGTPGVPPLMQGQPIGAQLDQRIDGLLQQLRAREVRLLNARRATTDANANVASYLMNWGMTFACALLVWCMVALHRHQTGRRAAERAVRASEAQLRLITDSVPALIGYAERSGRLLFHNRGLEAWFGRKPGSVRGSTLRELFGEEAYGAVEPRVASVLKGQPADFVFALRTAAGEEKELSAQLVPRTDDSEHVIGYYALFTDVTALKQVERLKSEFVSTVSHELRTPLTSIRGSLGLVSAGVTGPLPAKAKELLDMAVQNCERLVRLVNDILDSERMLSGKMTFHLEPVALRALVERSVRETEAFAAARQVQVTLAADSVDASVRGDADRLLQVITNLLSNAAKFSPAGGLVDVRIDHKDGSARVSVADRGPGVPADAQGKLFERFMQVDSSDVRRAGGTGLGLNICKAIIEKLGGRIGYESRSGGGSVFSFEMPALALTASASAGAA